MQINSKLPDNICCQILSLSEFEVYIHKLQNLWTGIITPKFEKADEECKWVMPYLKYDVGNESYYLIWMFIQSELKEEEILSEIQQFLKDEKEEINESKTTTKDTKSN